MVCDVEVLSSRFFREGRVDSGLDSCDSSRSGLGLSPVGGCRVPLKEQGHLTRLEIDASDRGLGLILGDLIRERLIAFNLAWLERGMFTTGSWETCSWVVGSEHGLCSALGGC